MFWCALSTSTSSYSAEPLTVLRSIPFRDELLAVELSFVSKCVWHFPRKFDLFPIGCAVVFPTLPIFSQRVHCFLYVCDWLWKLTDYKHHWSCALSAIGKTIRTLWAPMFSCCCCCRVRLFWSVCTFSNCVISLFHPIFVHCVWMRRVTPSHYFSRNNLTPCLKLTSHQCWPVQSTVCPVTSLHCQLVV